MIRVFIVLAAGLGFGAFLAWRALDWPLPVRPGWIGGAVLLAIAIAVRIYWERRRREAGDDPGARERVAWQLLVGVGVTCGHLIAALFQPVDLHLGSGNTLAVDNWTLGGAAALAWFVIRPRDLSRDERDREMAALGARTAYLAAVALFVGTAFVLGFGKPLISDRPDPFVLGNVMMVLAMAVLLSNYAARLIGYWLAARPVDDHE